MVEAFEFNPGIFEVPNEMAAREIILTSEAGMDSNERWVRETAMLTPILQALNGPVLDIGCGSGRLSKVLVNDGATVVGVDESASMREFARTYVGGRLGAFTAVGWDELGSDFEAGEFNSAVACWALQHFPQDQLRRVIPLVRSSLAEGGTLLLVNRWNRAIPVRMVDEPEAVGWWDDKFDLAGFMLEHFDLISHQDIPADICEPGAFIRYYRRKP